MGEQRGSGLCRGRTENVEIDVEIRVHQAMTHPDHARPWNFGALVARLGADPRRGFTRNLQGVHQGKYEHFIAVEVFTLPALGESNGRIEAVSNMTQANADPQDSY